MSAGGHGEPITREVFPVEVVRQFRKHALAMRRTLRNRGPHEWCRADFDAEALIGAFPSLSLRPGYRLLTYFYHSNGNGNGVVVAYPEASETYRDLAIECLAPEVRFDDEVVQVVFHTFTEMGRQHVTCWTDVYTDSYAPACESEEVAVGGPGFMF
jgi:hypothetical protein